METKNKQKIVMPQVGDTIYLESMLYLNHGVDDFHGGKCTISKVIPGQAGQGDLRYETDSRI